MTTKREAELAAKVEELEKVNENLNFDLDWERLQNQKLMAVMVQANRDAKRTSRGTQPARKMGTQGQPKTKVRFLPTSSVTGKGHRVSP